MIGAVYTRLQHSRAYSLMFLGGFCSGLFWVSESNVMRGYNNLAYVLFCYYNSRVFLLGFSSLLCFPLFFIWEVSYCQ